MLVAGIAPLIALFRDVADDKKTKEWPDFIKDSIDFTNHWSWVFYLCVFTSWCIGKWILSSGNYKSWSILQSLVDQIQHEVFPNDQNGCNDSFKVTIFKQYKTIYRHVSLPKAARPYAWLPWSRSRNPYSGWLVPVIRSGHTGKGTKVRFLAPNSDGDGRDGEGIAGRCWATWQVVNADQLPKITSSSGGLDRETYSKISYLPRWLLDDFAQKDKRLACCMMAFPIENASGRPWGVLVIDGENASCIDYETAYKAYTVIMPVLRELVEELS